LEKAVISFLDSVKDYGSKRIGPVDFSVEKGEIFGFLGPNGSGKTTCIRMLLGLVRPNSGSVRLKGLDPLKSHVQALKKVGYSPELPNIQTFLTPRELLKLTAHEVGLRASDMRSEMESALETVGLTEYVDVKIGRLSKGMVQRLSIAQALVGSPDVLVMDEPMLGLDPAGTAHLRDVFRGFSEAGGTILLSSHIMSEVEDLCSSVAMIHNGRVLFKGPLKEVVNQVLGEQELVVEAKGVTDECLRSIGKVEGVIGVAVREGFITVSVKIGAEARPEIARLIVESGAQLYTIREGERMLERAYIDALGREKP
jgi:ABC-2 type transport system ATP-binding protein